MCFPLVVSAPEPILHNMNGGGRPDVRHELQAIVVRVLACFLPVTSAQEPIEHSTSGGDRPA